MIPGNPLFIKVGSPEEAVEAWGQHPEARYLAGGTEIHTNARRLAAYRVGALVDIKGLAELERLDLSGDVLYLGAAVNLSRLCDSALWPLLSAAARGVADRTVRNRLTLGGNIAGQLPYREAVLPLLAADAILHSIVPAGQAGGCERRQRALRDCFDKRLRLEPGELITGFSVARQALGGRWYRGRRTRTAPVDYPLITLCACEAGPGTAASLGSAAKPSGRDAVLAAGNVTLAAGNVTLAAGGAASSSQSVALAVSGLYPYPWRSDESDRCFGERLAAWRADRLAAGAGAASGAATGAANGAASTAAPVTATVAASGAAASDARAVAAAIAATMPPPRDDSRASAEYRQELLRQLLAEALEALA